jgi:hypothetical protein
MPNRKILCGSSDYCSTAIAASSSQHFRRSRLQEPPNKRVGYHSHDPCSCHPRCSESPPPALAASSGTLSWSELGPLIIGSHCGHVRSYDRGCLSISGVAAPLAPSEAPRRSRRRERTDDPFDYAETGVLSDATSCGLRIEWASFAARREAPLSW